MNCANALETIARHYVLTMDLVEHYKANLDLRYLALRYEDMIADMPGSVRLMSEFIGVPFDSRCVDFHENRRLPQTPSYAQVSEKLYDRSRYRYRAYRHHLEPVIPILKPVISRLGYVIEAATDDNPAASHGAGTAARNAAARLDAPPSAAAMFG